MTIQENIDTIKSIKTQIKDAINEKGGNVDDNFSTYAQAIKDLSTGEPSTGNTGGITSIYVGDTITFDSKEKFELDAIEWKSNINADDAFNGCTGLTKINTLKVYALANRMFESCTNLERVSSAEINATAAISMFKNCSKLSMVNGIINGYELGYMFWGCQSLTTLPEIITTNGCVVDGMFGQCNSLQSLTGDFIGVYSSDSMFTQCGNLQTVPNIEFDETGQRTASDMFGGCNNLENIGGLTNLKVSVSFGDCPKLTQSSIQNLINTLGNADGSQIITFNSNSEDKITDVMRTTLINKGWNIQII